MLIHNQAQSKHDESSEIVPRILIIIVCIISAILISLVDFRPTINSLTIELMSDQERSFRLYYDTGRGYNEQESVDGEILGRDKQATTYHFPIPNDKTLFNIRIDPDEQPTRYFIKTVSLNYLYYSKRVYPRLTWNSGQIERLFVPLHNVKPFVLQQGYLLVETEGPDPYFGTKENLSEMWGKLKDKQPSLLLPIKIGCYLLLALTAIFFLFQRYVSLRLKKISHLLSKAVIFGFVTLFAISVYFILSGGRLSIGVNFLIFYWIYLAGVFFIAGWITLCLLNFVCRDLFRDSNLSQCIILAIVSPTIAAILLHLPLNSTLHMVVILSLCVFCVFDYKRILNCGNRTMSILSSHRVKIDIENILLRLLARIQPDTKNMYGFLSVCVLFCAFVIVLLTFRDYGVSWDEIFQVTYGNLVKNFYASGFQDRSANNYGDSILYGGFFELIANLFYLIIPSMIVVTEK